MMHKKVFLIIVLLFVMLFQVNGVFAENTQTEKNGCRIYYSIEMNDIKSLMVEGVDLSKNGFLNVYQYLVVEKKLFVVGMTDQGKYEFSSISISDQKKERISNCSSSETKFRLFEMHKLEKSTFAIVENVESSGGNIEVYMGSNWHDFKLINKAETLSRARIFIGDTNSDGFEDILVWKKAEENKTDVKNTGEMMVMLFDSENFNFSDLTTLRKADSIN